MKEAQVPREPLTHQKQPTETLHKQKQLSLKIEPLYGLGLFVTAADLSNQCREEGEGGLSGGPHCWSLYLCLNPSSGGEFISF